MIASQTSRAAVAPSACSRSISRKSVVCLAQQKTDGPSIAQRCTAGMLSAALATSMVLSGPAAVQAAPKAERESYGAGRTEALIKEGGTPGASRPDNMKTNVPFQAPGISQSPRGKGQERGTNPVEVGKNIKKVIKEQTLDPDSTPLGISKGPLVKEAKKMDQPGTLKNIAREGAYKLKTLPPPEGVKGTKSQKPVDYSKKGIINGSFTTGFGGRNQDRKAAGQAQEIAP